MDAADADDDGRLSISDGLRVLRAVFGGGPPPPAPFPHCGSQFLEELARRNGGSYQRIVR